MPGGAGPGLCIAQEHVTSFPGGGCGVVNRPSDVASQPGAFMKALGHSLHSDLVSPWVFFRRSEPSPAVLWSWGRWSTVSAFQEFDASVRYFMASRSEPHQHSGLKEPGDPSVPWGGWGRQVVEIVAGTSGS